VIFVATKPKTCWISKAHNVAMISQLNQDMNILLKITILAL